MRDSNPRYSFPYTRFPGVLLQPLGQLSTGFKTVPVQHCHIASATIYRLSFFFISVNYIYKNLNRQENTFPLPLADGPLKSNFISGKNQLETTKICIDRDHQLFIGRRNNVVGHPMGRKIHRIMTIRQINQIQSIGYI